MELVVICVHVDMYVDMSAGACVCVCWEEIISCAVPQALSTVIFR